MEQPLSVLIFFPCELSACVSIISCVLTQILSQFGSAPTHPQMSLDGLFFLSAGANRCPEKILAMRCQFV